MGGGDTCTGEHTGSSTLASGCPGCSVLVTWTGERPENRILEGES